MALLDAPMAKLAATLTKTFGDSATLTVQAGSSYQTGTGDTSSTPTEYTVHPTPGDEAMLGLFPDSLVQRGDRTAIIAASEVGVQPKQGASKLSWLGKVWMVEGVHPLNSGGADAAYVLLLRS